MNISRKITLKKRRVNVSSTRFDLLEQNCIADDVAPKKYDAPLVDKIDIFQISHVPFTSEEEAERAETLGMVHDPEWLAKGKEAQEGELSAAQPDHPVDLVPLSLITAKEKAEADIFGNGTDADGEGDEDMPLPARTNGVHSSQDNMDED